MKWSKLKLLIESRFAPSINKRISFHSTHYGCCCCFCGRMWITLDGKEVVNFCTMLYYKTYREEFFGDLDPLEFEEKSKELGMLRRLEAHQACWDFIHQLSIEEALQSKNALIQTLAILDARVGKRTLKKMRKSSISNLAQLFLRLRLDP